MATKRFLKLIVWEFEEFLSFPILEFLIASTVFLVLFQPLTLSPSLESLRGSNSFLSIFVIFIAGTIFSRSFAGSLDRGETKMLLSYPIKRWELFLTKFITQFFVLFAIYFTVSSLNIPLMGLSPFEPLFYASFLGLLLHLMVVCTIATAISLLVKKETITVLVSTIFLFGLETIADNQSYLSGNGRSKIIFEFVQQSIGISSQSIAFQEFALALLLPIVTSLFLFLLSLIYFSFIMEVD